MNAINDRRKPAWSILGGATMLEGASSIEDALAQAELDWRVSTIPLTAGDVTVDSHRAVVNTTSGDVLGVVKRKYVPVQNAEALAVLDDLKGVSSDFEYIAAGQTGGRVWVLADLGGFEVQKGDEMRRQVMLANSFDGSTPVAFSLLPFRMFCANQVASIAAKSALKVRHTGDVSTRLDLAAEAMFEMLAEYYALEERLKLLTTVTLTDALIKRTLDTLYPLEDGMTKRTRNTRESRRGRIIELVENGAGNHTNRTAWTLYNAVTEWFTHEHGTDRNRWQNLAFRDSPVVRKVHAVEELLLAEVV